MKNFRFITLSLLLIISEMGCGKASNLESQRDRDREISALLAKDYLSLQGSYSNAGDSGSSFDVKSDILLTYVASNVAPTAGAGVVPQPVLAGRFILKARPNGSAKALSQGDPISFSFSNGVFDPASGVFAVKISGINTDGINITCNRNKNDGQLSCIWVPASGGNESFKFVLDKLS